MPESPFEIVLVPSGAASLRSREHAETFHPGIGPMAEAQLLHVAQHEFRERLEGNFVIWDVGLGAGANALAVVEAVLAFENKDPQVELRSFDLTVEALRFALGHAQALKYPVRWVTEIAALLEYGEVEIGNVRWKLELGDFRQTVLGCPGASPRAVLFDPYSPSSNPGMWTREVFRAIRERADADCTLSSYSRSTAVRARLMLAGWHVGRGVATGGKTETTVAATRLDRLRAPLGREWLERLRRSNAAGLQEEAKSVEELAAQLAQCEQMKLA